MCEFWLNWLWTKGSLVSASDVFTLVESVLTLRMQSNSNYVGDVAWGVGEYSAYSRKVAVAVGGEVFSWDIVDKDKTGEEEKFRDE